MQRELDAALTSGWTQHMRCLAPSPVGTTWLELACLQWVSLTPVQASHLSPIASHSEPSRKFLELTPKVRPAQRRRL